VYASCERAGSLDSAIRHAALNDFESLRQRCPLLKLVAHNGSESAKHAHKLRALLGESVQVVTLPSTSPANARMTFDAKLTAWQQAWTLAA
jgi:double-stranded uracil-DNA glycosylase